jgi:primosomal protein N' (replication factor Y)
VFLVGVISADIGLLNPDFRSSERTLQLLMQVAGRPGRKSDKGNVIIQTMHTDNHIFPMVKNHDYTSFYEMEIAIRKNFNYPPFSRMSLIEVSGKDTSLTATLAAKVYLFLTKHRRSDLIEVMKPAPALIFKLKNLYRWHVIIKSIKPSAVSSNETENNAESLLIELQKYLKTLESKHGVKVTVDVDPLDFY